MTDGQKQYYYEMAQKDRLLILYVNGESEGLITFFIGNGNPTKYIDRDPWSVVTDEPEGDTLYVDHLLTSKKDLNRHVALEVWKDVKKHIRDNFKNVKHIRWNRFKRGWGKPKTFKEEI